MVSNVLTRAFVAANTAPAAPGSGVGGINLSDLMPNKEAMGNVLGLWLMFGVLALILHAWKSDSTIRMITNVLSIFVMFLALGATFAAIPIVGVLLSNLISYLGWGNTLIALLCLAFVVAAKLVQTFPRMLSSGTLLLVVGVVGGFAASNSPELKGIVTGVASITTLVVYAVQVILQVIVLLCDLLIQFMPKGNFTINR